jgi:hypothetical protein
MQQVFLFDRISLFSFILQTLLDLQKGNVAAERAVHAKLRILKTRSGHMDGYSAFRSET